MIRLDQLPVKVLRDLKRSGLSRTDAREMHIEDHGDRYRLHYFDLDGTVNGFYRDRFVGMVLPRDKHGKTMRYTQPPKKSPRLYFPPLGVDWTQVARDPTKELVICEGEKKAAAACKHGFPTVGLGGVWNWKSKGEPIDDLHQIEWDKRRVAIVFDSDAVTNRSVRRAEQDLADWLDDRGAVARVVRLPSDAGKKVGLDDYLVKHGAKELRKLLAMKSDDEGMTFAELLDQDLPPVKWVIPGLIPIGLTLLAGKPKIGKSWLAVAVSVAVAKGERALGQYLCAEGDVLHLALEDTKRRFQNRVKKLLGDAPPPTRAHIFIRWRKVEKEGLAKLREWLQDHPKARLVVIDTLAKMRPRAGKGDSNSYHTDYDDLGAIKQIADDFNVGIVVIHHLRKMEAVDPLDEISGTTGTSAAPDTIMVLKRSRKEGTGTLHITGRDVAEQEWAVKFDGERGLWTVLGKAEEVYASEARTEINHALTKLGRPAQPHEVAEFLGKSRDTVKKMMQRMAYKDQLVSEPGGKYSKKESTSSSNSGPHVPTSPESPLSPQSPKRGHGDTGTRSVRLKKKAKLKLKHRR